MVISAVKRIGPRVEVNPDTLRGWCKQAAIDAARRRPPLPRMASGSRNSSARSRSSYGPTRSSWRPRVSSRPATAVVVRLLAAHKDRFGSSRFAGSCPRTV